MNMKQAKKTKRIYPELEFPYHNIRTLKVSPNNDIESPDAHVNVISGRKKKHTKQNYKER